MKEKYQGFVTIPRDVQILPLYDNAHDTALWLYCVLHTSHQPYRKTTGEKLLKQKSNSTFCSITEAAVILDLEEREIYRLIEYGDIHALKAGRRLLIRMEDIQN